MKYLIAVMLLCPTLAFANPQVKGQPMMSRQRFDLTFRAANVWYRGHEAKSLLQHFRYRSELELGGNIRWWLDPRWSFYADATRGMDSRLATIRVGGEIHLLGVHD